MWQTTWQNLEFLKINVSYMSNGELYLARYLKRQKTHKAGQSLPPASSTEISSATSFVIILKIPLAIF